MNRMVFVLMLGLLSLCIYPLAHGAPPKDSNCVPDQGCPEDEFPPKCCKPPPCEFWDELEQATARTQFLAGKMLGVGDEGSLSEGQYAEFMKDVGKEFKKIRKAHPKCPKSKLGDVPIFSVLPDSGDCRVSAYVNKSFQPLSLADVLETTAACDELVAAKYEAAYVSEAYCSMESNYADKAKEQFEKALREKTFLEDQLMHYWSVCTIAPDAEIAQIVAKNTVDKLKKITTKNQWTKKKAARAAKSRKSR